ncbi:MAG: ribonuclease H-like domain-containing protein [Chloroflexia bacterium]|nr:ribonuclease H-like domain-containing protein [Chloroflexia bacterium]
MRVYQRQADGTTSSMVVADRPWVVTVAGVPLGSRNSATSETLRGNLPLSEFHTFADRRAHGSATSSLPMNDPNSLNVRSPISRFLMISGMTLFKEMAFTDIRRLQLDIETLGLVPEEPDAQIIMIALRLGTFEDVLVLETTEADLLERLSDRIQELDPDVIEGHNIFNFDLPFLAERARRHDVTLRFGRDGSAPFVSTTTRRFRVGPVSLPFTAVHVHGRHVIDTYQQVQRWDTQGRLTSYGLKPVIRGLGLEREDRQFVEGEQIASMWRAGERSRDRLARYALDDVRDVDLLSRITLPTEFYQTQILPMAFQTATISGTGTKIDHLMSRAYLSERHSLPTPSPARDFPGGFIELIETGLFGPVVKCDVESLYPSIMLDRNIASKTDVLRAYPLFLGDLTRRRIEAKRMVATTSGEEQALWDGLQGTFKILINSFYGYLGFGRGRFNDYDAAEEVTVVGQQVIQDVVANLRARGAQPIEVDTDGVFFSPPDDVRTRAEEDALIAAVGNHLPRTIRLAHDGRYARMLSLKLKTYALLDYDDHLTLKGSALRNRRMEPCFQELLRTLARLFLTDRRDDAREAYFSLAGRIQDQTLEPRDFSQWSMLKQSTIDQHPRLKQLLTRLPGGWRYGERLEVYERQDGSLALVEEYDRDENRSVLLRHLRDTATRFEQLFDSREEFDAFFPPIKPETDLDFARARRPVQQLGLF